MRSLTIKILLAIAVAEIASGCGPSVPPPIITTASLPGGTIGTAYSQTIGSSGGVAPLSWSVTSGGLPDNLTLGSSSSSGATISGMPDQVQANVNFGITVTDSRGLSSTQSFTVNIAGTPGITVTQSGAVQGQMSGTLIAFRGIPYAAPPVGNLRWKPPQPVASWKGVRDATKFGNICPQINSNGQYAGDEDCLVLNVYISQPPPNQSEPVMVFLHGGGNTRGDTQSAPTILDLPPLANQGVVVVTVEYRLGILGFLAAPELTAEGGGSSGHYGLMDAIAALTWVQQNIAAFGGDPKHVLLFGQSAGSWGVQSLLAAPSAQGLFSAAAMESGALPSPSSASWLVPLAVTETQSAPFVTAMGCANQKMPILACLRAVSATTIVNYTGQVGYGSYGDPFLPVDPFTYLQQNGPPVPLLIGSNREEYSVLGDNPTAPTAPTDAATYSTAIHARFDQFGGTTVGDQVLSLYPTSDYSSPAYALIAADTDFYFTCIVRSAARAAATTANHKPVWRYLYTHTFENDATLTPWRAFHTAELFFLFGTYSGLSRVHTPTQAELTFTSDLMGYWTRFAATGNPNGAGAVTWPSYDSSTDSMLQLDDNFVQINGYHNAQCDYLATLPQF